MRIRHPMSLVAIWALLAMIACGDETVVGTDQLEALVMANSQAVRDAAEAFAAESNFYPSDLDSDTAPSGNTLIDFLPGGAKLVNPFTGQRTEPVMKAVATERGETAYALNSWCTYTVTGRGNSDIIVTLREAVPEHVLVEANCLAVQAAAEAFAAENDGVYPANHSVDITPMGNTMVDLLGGRLQNPFTLVNSEPANGTATLAGQTGYVPVIVGGTNGGYTITGYGRSCLIVVIGVPSL